jgi:hypothetical protein
MISLEDCIALCGLDAEEVEAIGEHEHLPQIEAAAVAHYLLQQPGGPGRIRDMIIDDVRAALRRGETGHARDLLATLQHFMQHFSQTLPH